MSDEVDLPKEIWHEDSRTENNNNKQQTLADALRGLSASFLTAFYCASAHGCGEGYNNTRADVAKEGTVHHAW
ncbi:hypothetical protein CORC01_08380 [Colletotrichum orchidophilum]|uniref:Uncharacterized protein n=1 Tax=Colletotrichum orchidophilum TaxID=1209926 RepID=A0A1G4B4E1_9PEZI|nr:uncharacterized protein CORC01_08380 [Colletotrichum orchidophilum]OHE96308.1 hypothetical protein CORC01_08380 [Colletotrichum orchidophilum]